MILDYDDDILADTMIFDATPDTNYGSSPMMRTYKTTGEHIRSYVMFSLDNLTHISPNSIVTAKWYGYVYRVDGDVINAHIYGVNATWNENRLLWGSQPCSTAENNPGNDNCNGTASDSLTNLASGNWYSFDVLPALRKALAEKKSDISFVILANEDWLGDGAGQYYYTKEEKTNANLVHYLNVTYVPPTKAGFQLSSKMIYIIIIIFLLVIIRILLWYINSLHKKVK
ncbi:DNRLRE domain-containing protein [Candidatus Woesearchaeota archaeon]|nr:DNRLRE domain-containing protein [Candidatus Woesearchaeota archaeon]